MQGLEFRTLVKRSAQSPVAIYEGIHKVQGRVEGAVYAVHGWERTEEEIRFGTYIANERTADGLALMVERGTAPRLTEKIGEHRVVDLIVTASPLARGTNVTLDQVADAMEQWMTAIREHVRDRPLAAAE